MTVLRKCDNLEINFVCRNTLDMSSVVFSWAEYTQPLTRAVLDPALSQLIKENGELAVNVVTPEDNPRFNLLDEVDLDSVVIYKPDWDLQHAADVLFDPAQKLPYESALPLWRLYIIGQDAKELLFVFDHSICDGVSSVLFQNKLVAALNQEYPAVDAKVRTVGCEMGPSIESLGLVDIPYYKKLANFAWKLLNRFVKTTPAAAQKWAGPMPMWPPKNESVFLEVDADTVAKLIKATKHYNITMQSLLYAATMQATALLCPETERDKVLNFFCPIDARRYHGGVEGRLGNYVFIYGHDLTNYKPQVESGRFVVEWAQDFNAKLKQALAQCTDIAYAVGALSLVKNTAQHLKDSVKNPRGSAAEVSNVGVLKFDDSQKFSINKLCMTQPTNTHGSYVQVSAATVKGKSMMVNISLAAEDKVNCNFIKDELEKVLLSIHV